MINLYGEHKYMVDKLSTVFSVAIDAVGNIIEMHGLKFHSKTFF